MEVTGMAIVMVIIIILTVIIITTMDIPIKIVSMVMAGIIIMDQGTATIVGGEIKGEESGISTYILPHYFGEQGGNLSLSVN
jgi:hypothetical protein